MSESETKLSNSNVPEIRTPAPVDESSKPQNSRPADASPLDNDAESDADKKKRLSDAEISTGRAICEELFGSPNAPRNVARAFARFDPEDPRPQPAENYSFSCARLNADGFI